MSVALYGEDDLSAQHISETLQALSIHRLETWTDSTGRFHREARFLGLTAGKVILRLKDGEIMEIPLNKLSEDSQATAVACSILRKRYDEKSSAQAQ